VLHAYAEQWKRKKKVAEKNQESARALAATFPDSIFMIAEGRV
jgi:hypothetical protein